ncbi:MAG: glycosyltransferase [Sulfurimicrobium sp.]|nr:glycosyltransferase [Sulfurimicrobium sp.]MDP1703539.1 glycosyltransferase [Sulfurimicrobium sp.]MDP2200047.1 glycosyltransferase [Sulfurimicrobium sp.]MDP3686105.1 glycosyltransferase [Sulfurimicrobium sp.]MDZ7656165.1 glycosyltransferase [Sulfurimicrobium sp.]
MKILMISDVYFPRINGVSTSIATYRDELEERGHEVHLIAPDYDGVRTDDEFRIRRVPARHLPFDPEDRLLKARCVLVEREALKNEEFDLIHIQTPFVAHYLGVKLAKELGIPRVETYHTYFEEYLYHYLPFLPKGSTRILARSLSRRQCNDLDALVVPSHGMLDVLRGYGIQTRAEVIPTGLPVDNFTPGDGAAFRARHRIPPQRPVMLYVGRVAFEKNIGFLLHVTARIRRDMPDVLLIIAGEGPALNLLKSQAAQLGIGNNVLFVGYLDRKSELPDCYRAANVFVFSSCTETQGLVLLEAMAQATPVVALAELGTRDVLQEGQGTLIAAHEIEDFAAKTMSLLQSADKARQLGERGYEYACGWSAGALAERMLDFYQRTMDRRYEVPTRSQAYAPSACLEKD